MDDHAIKTELARRQLGTALALFLSDDDPVSVHCLACGGGELAEFLASAAGEKAFSQHALDVHPEMTPAELATIRNKYWNAMKHAKARAGEPRRDAELMSTFDDEHNDHVLFVGWHDFAMAVGKLPIEAQVFQVWYFAKFPEKLAAEFSSERFEEMFPDILRMNRADQKRALKRRIQWARKHKSVMQHPKTDRRKLIIGRTAAE